MPHDDLELRVAWQHHVGRSTLADRWLDSVLSRYREPTRHYHGITHLRWVVRHIGSFSALAVDPGAVTVAGFFHDSIYDAMSAGNEERSADLATEALRELGWEPARIDRVATMVRATAGHEVPGVDVDHDVLLAADLAVLATEPNRYGDYVRNVRREYAHVTDADWQTGRTAVLRTFLDRDRIYSTRLELEQWERRARANIAAELADLAR